MAKLTYHPRYQKLKEYIVEVTKEDGTSDRFNLLGKTIKKEVTEKVGCCGNEEYVTYEVDIRGATQADYKKYLELQANNKIKSVVEVAPKV